MALPSYSPYSTVKNSFEQFMGNPTTSATPSQLPQPNTSTPIQYPDSSYRQGVDNISVNTFGNLTPQEKIARQADRIYGDIKAKELATQRISGEALTQGLGALQPLNSFESQNVNRYVGAGYSPQQAYMNRWNTSVDLQRGGPMVKTNPYQQSLERSLNYSNELRAGVPSGTIEDAYKKVLGLV